MPRTLRRPARSALTFTPRVKVWLEVRGRYAFGLGISEILQAIDTTGSIKSAAGQLGKSYRYVWGRLKEAERAFGRPLVDARVGGKHEQRSSLTPEARQALRGFLALRSRMTELVHQEFNRQFP